MNGKEAADINGFADSLNQTEKHVLALYYADRLTLAEIAQVLNLTSERVGEILYQLGRRAVEYGAGSRDRAKVSTAA